MKQGKLLSKTVIILFMLVIIAYVAVYLWQSINNPFHTMIAYAQTVNESEPITGFLVRDETVLSGTGTLIEPLFEEGENVAYRETVVLIYQNEEALSRKKEIDALKQQLTLLEYVRSSSTVEDTKSLDETILSEIITLRSSAATGDMSDLEENALTLRSLVLKRGYSYGSASESRAEIQNQITECGNRLSELSAQTANDTTAVTAPCSGLFSSVVDGYENLITVDMLDSLTVADLESLSAQTVSGGGLGKIIQGIKWYFAAVVDEETAGRLGSSATLVFSRDYSGSLTMNIDRIGEAENGKCVVVFSSDRNMADITLLRCQTVEVILSQYSGIRVPIEAVRLNDDGQPGVYTVVGIQARFKPVSITYSGDGYYLVTPAVEPTEDNYLRAGEEIIVAAEDLYDGKVVSG